MASVKDRSLFETTKQAGNVKQALESLTLSSATITNIQATNIVFTGQLNGIPAGDVVTEDTVQTFTNKSLSDSTTKIISNTDATKILMFDVENTTGITQTFRTTATINSFIDFPSVGATLVGRDTTDILTNKTITGNTMASFLTGVGNTISITPGVSDDMVLRTIAQTLTNKTLTLPTIASINNGGTIAIPVGADTFVTLTAVQTLTGKTLTAPVISTITNVGTLTLPTATTTLVGRTTTDTLENKTLIAESTIIQSSVATNRRINFDVSGATSSTTLTIRAVQTANVIITLPTDTSTLVTENGTQTLSNKTLSTTTTFIDSIDATKQLIFNLSGQTTSVSTTLSFVNTVNSVVTFPTGTVTIADTTSNQLLTNKRIATSSTVVDSVDNTKVLAINTSAITTATTRTLTYPDLSGTIAFINAAQTYTVPITVGVATNQIVLGTPNTTTINAVNPAANRVYSLPDAGRNANFILSISATTQVISNIQIANSANPVLELNANTGTGVHTLQGTDPVNTSYAHTLQAKDGTLANTSDRTIALAFDADFSTTALTYVKVKRFLYMGSNNINGAISRFSAAINVTNTVNASIRIIIANTATVVASILAHTGTGADEIVTTTSFSNIPATETMFELQIQMDAAGTIVMYAASLQL